MRGVTPTDVEVRGAAGAEGVRRFAYPQERLLSLAAPPPCSDIVKEQQEMTAGPHAAPDHDARC